jgi:hypothetical protein
MESTFGEPDSTRLLPFPLAGIALLNEECRTCESTFGEPDSTRLLPFPLAGIALLNEECRTCESDFSRPARESRLGVTFKPKESVFPASPRVSVKPR